MTRVGPHADSLAARPPLGTIRPSSGRNWPIFGQAIIGRDLVDEVLAHPDGPRAWADVVGIPIELRASSDKLRDKYRARWPFLEETSSRKKLVYRPGSYSHQPPVTN